MLVHHPTMERKSYSLKIHLTFHLPFPDTKDEFVRFSSTPLFDLLDHEDANEIIDFTDHSCRDLFTLVFDHNDDSIIVDFSKPPIYDDLSVDEVKTPQTIEALKPKLMVMSIPHCPEVSFISDQEILGTTDAPSSLICMH